MLFFGQACGVSFSFPPHSCHQKWLQVRAQHRQKGYSAAQLHVLARRVLPVRGAARRRVHTVVPGPRSRQRDRALGPRTFHGFPSVLVSCPTISGILLTPAQVRQRPTAHTLRRWFPRMSVERFSARYRAPSLPRSSGGFAHTTNESLCTRTGSDNMPCY